MENRTKKDFNDGCFSPNWLEVDLRDASEIEIPQVAEIEQTVNKEVSLESRRKDLNTLLKELDEIKQNIEKAVEKQHRLSNLMGLYTGEFAQ